MSRPLTDAMRAETWRLLLTFAVGDKVRYRPGVGTYGYEDLAGADGRVPAVVTGRSPSTVRLLIETMPGYFRKASVDPRSLTKEPNP